MSAQVCSNCGKSTSSAGGLCDACRLGVPLDTPGLHVEYPPPRKPPLRARLLSLLVGPVATTLVGLAVGAVALRLADIYPDLRPAFFRAVGIALGLAITYLLIAYFTSYSISDALYHLFGKRTWLCEILDDLSGRPDLRPMIVCAVLALTLFLGYLKFGQP